MNVRIFKLVDGSEIIGRAHGFDENLTPTRVSLSDPLEIKYRVGYDGMASAVMTRYNYFGDEKVVNINASAIVMSYAVSEKYIKVYEESLDTTHKQATDEPASKAESIKEALKQILSSNNTVH